MSYNYNIPQPTDALSTSQGQILANFTLLGSIAGNANTSSASINTTSGFNWLYLATQTNIPPTGSSFTSGNVALYSALNSGSSQNELYINKSNFAGVAQISATSSILSLATPTGLSSGFTDLPSGIRIIWGTFTIGSSPSTITYSYAFTNQTLAIVPYSTTNNVFFGINSAIPPTNSSASITSSSALGGTGGFIAIGY
jgi:hypothetical protein